MTASRDIARLIELMAALRTPGSGCPWDLEQSFATIAPYTIEEAYEVAEAIARGDLEDLREELGDLLFAVVNLARHVGADPETALRSANAKFERRFAAIERALAARGKSPQQSTLTEMDALWDAAKAAEREENK